MISVGCRRQRLVKHVLHHAKWWNDNFGVGFSWMLIKDIVISCAITNFKLLFQGCEKAVFDVSKSEDDLLILRKYRGTTTLNVSIK